MPELPEVETARRLLEPAMRGAVFERVHVRRAGLRRAFPPDFAARLTGASVEDVRRRAKYLMLPLSSGETLVMHLGMSGSVRVEPRGAFAPPGLHDHVVFEMSSGHVVTFTDPRRFGAMDLLTADKRDGPPAAGLGPEPLSAGFDAAALARACVGRRAPLKAALLDQRVVAGLGNIYVVEALHRAGLSPKRRASTLATPRGRPRGTAERLVGAIKEVIAAAIARQSAGDYRSSSPFRIYDRDGQPCPTQGCGGLITRIVQAGRSTYFCPVCQR